MQSPVRALLPLLFIFLIFLIAPLAFSGMLERNHIDKNVILGANALFFLVSLISFSIQMKGMINKNPHVFVRSVTGGMMVKMAFCIVAVIAYVYLSGPAFNKRGIFISLFLYLVYLSVEVMVVMKMNKKQHA